MARTPVHLWIVGGLSLLWNAGGAMDYTMTKLQVPSYLEALPDASVRMLQDAPIWFDFSWPIGVWFSVLGSLFLLGRSRFASTAFALSFAGLIVSSIYTYGLSDGGAMMAMSGPVAIIFTVSIPVILALLWIYARVMTLKGVLR